MDPSSKQKQPPNAAQLFSGSVPDPMAIPVHSTASSVPNPIKGLATTSGTAAEAQEETMGGAVNNKRTALAGQWRTPPTPFFPNGEKDEAPGLIATTTVSAPATTIKTEITVSGETPPVQDLPNSTEDYAKALQEAYRRGAEAAARAAAQQQLVTVSSNPDLILQSGASTDASVLPVVPSATISSSVVQAPASAPTLQHHPEVVTSMPPPAPVAAPVATPVIIPAPLPPQHQQQQQQTQQRSISMPDMASYAAQQEDEKRQKRLARNRASARLRRLRKKNLVDAYETEVVALEKTIKQLQEHQWGSSDPSALLEALSMDRGQQQLSPIERIETASGILTQQLQFLQQLEDIMQEQHVLYEVAREISKGTLETSEWKDLGASLQLSSEQCQSLLKEAVGWEEEWHALQTIKTSLQALKENKWLWNEGCAAITDQFLSILHKNQISKFLLWADHNAEAIEELDAVHAVDKMTDSPVFQFGVDNNPNELLEDEKQPST